ncbi:MAG: prepilin-type N-terminal cleavage/methylation domain-containing protein [bacterium]|nr:prepilin-type N-terminal cleavage/methylation domain-containing protein [bacterium]
MESSGYSLVELIAVMAVMVILFTVTSLQIGKSNPNGTVHDDGNSLKSTITLARTYARTGHHCCGDILPPAYGVRFKMDGPPDSTYFLYADLDGDNVFSPADEILIKRALSENVDFYECTDGVTTYTALGKCDIAFLTDLSRTATFEGGEFAGDLYLLIRYRSDVSITDQIVIDKNTLNIEN